MNTMTVLARAGGGSSVWMRRQPCRHTSTLGTFAAGGSPIMLGGPGVVVQIDESLFRHKPKVIQFRFFVPIC